MYRNISLRLLSIVVLLLSSMVASYGQVTSVTVSGLVKEKITKASLPFVNIVLKTDSDSAFVTGTITNEEGRFSITGVKPNNYYLEISYVGYVTQKIMLYVGSLSEFLNVPNIELTEEAKILNEVVVKGKVDNINEKMDKKTFSH